MRSQHSLAWNGIALLLAVLACVSSGSAQIAPDEDYRVFETEHFRVVFPAELEPFARRAASSAEWAHAALARHFLRPPRGRIALVVSDNSDFPNASATPIPFNRVTLIATPHIAARELSYYTDWIDLALVHELTHIFHLDRAAGIWSPFRTLFGRAPAFFPAFYQPRWVIEGIPTYYESRLTGAGRAYGGYFDMLLSSAALQDQLLSIDAADGLSPKWPAGQSPYVYGGLYFRSLAEIHGDSAVAAFAERGSARLPYTLDWAAKPHFGQSLSAGWDRWREGLSQRVSVRAATFEAHPTTRGQPLSEFSWVEPSPRHSPDGRLIAFSILDPREDPSTVIVDSETGQVVRRERRNTSGGNSWSPDGRRLVIEQAERADRYRIFADLYELDVQTGEQRRLSVAGRVGQPDVAPNGREIVAVQVGEGTNRLVVLDRETRALRALTEFAADVNWERPRWSPRGDQIAVERWQRGRVPNVVLLDRAGQVVEEVTRDDASDLAPTWSPDGRYLIWASDREGTFDIYGVELVAGARPVWRLTRTVGGALEPDVSPDGTRLAFVALHPEGFRVERIAFDPGEWSRAGSPVRRLREPADPGVAPRDSSITAPARGYSPFPSLWPRSWFPVLATGSAATGTFIGVTTFGSDDVQRHAYAAFAGWRTGVNDVEGGAAYSYRGWGDPTLEFSLSQDWSSGLLLVGDTVISALQREREARIASNFLTPRVRWALSFTPFVGVQRFRLFTDAPFSLADPTLTDLEAGLLVGFSTARGHPRSISSEDGLVTLVDLSHERLADDLERWRLTGELEVRFYRSIRLFGFANHVLAARLALGASSGHQRGADLFELGGVPQRGLDLGGGLRVGRGSDYPVRGFDEGVQFGDRAAAVSLEYRVPLWLVGRGYKLWPILLDRLSAAFFVDAGSAWFDASVIRALATAGSELSSDWGLGYNVNARFRLGIAHPIMATTEGWSVYLSVGAAY